MAELPVARRLLSAAPEVTAGFVVLTYDERLLRRKRIVTTAGTAFLVDLPAVTNLDDYWGFLLDDGRAVGVTPAEEDLLQVEGPDLVRYAWHIGNRHTPCQIEGPRLVIRADPVLEAMLTGLGARLSRVRGAFRPEGGAYGHGRTLGHVHSPDSFGWHGHGDGNLHDDDAQPQSLPYGRRDAT
jgi:urease accessory protein